MAVKTWTSERVTSADINTYLTNSGLVYVKQQTIGTGVSSVTVSSAFSSDFDNYKIIVSGGATNTNTALTLQLGSSTANYYFSLIYVTYSVGTVAGLAGNGTTGFTYAGVGTTDNIILDVDVLLPYAAKPTAITGNYMETRTGGSSGTMSGFHNSSTSYTSFSILSSSGTMTGGTIRVYGYRQA